MSIKKKYDPSPGGEEESFSDMLSPSRTSNTYNTSRNLNPPSFPTVNEELESDYDKSILTKENNPSVNLLAPQIRQASCTSRESIEKTKAKVIINAPSSIKNRPVNLKLINRRPTGFIRLTNEELSRDSSLYREASSKLGQKSIEEQLGAVTLRVPAKINKPANLKIVHRKPTGFIRTPPEADKSEDDEDNEDDEEDEDDETSTLNSIEEIPGNIIASLHGIANKNNQFEDCVYVDCPNYTKFQEHDEDQVKEFSPKRGDNGDDESCTDESENNSETNEFNNENDPVKREDESSSEERSSNSSANDSNEDQESESYDDNYDHRKDNLIQMPDGTKEISGDVDSGSSTSSNKSNEKISQESARVESEDEGSQTSLTFDKSSNEIYQYQDHSELCKSTDDKIEGNVSKTSHTSDYSTEIDSQAKDYPELQDFYQSPFEYIDQKTEYAVNNPIPDKWDIAISRLKLHQEHARTRDLTQIPTDPTCPTDDKNESESSSVSTGVPSLACCGIVKDYIQLEGSNESVGYTDRTKDSNSGSSIILEESNEENSKTKKQSKPSIDKISDEAGSSKERVRDRKVVTLIEDKTVVDFIEDKPKNIKILKRHPTGLIRTVHEYEIERRKKLKGPARFAFQCESFIIRDYWIKSKPAIKSIPVGGPPPTLPKRLKRK